MSIFKEDYFALLPSDLRKELMMFYLDYANTLIKLTTIIGIIILDEKSQLLIYTNTIFNITVPTGTLFETRRTSDEISFPYMVYIVVFYEFLKNYINNHTFKFLIVDKLQPLPKLSGIKFTAAKTLNEISDQKREALNKLTNNEEKFEVALRVFRDNLFFELHYNRIIYTLNDVQSEVLIYKLIKFYNDLIMDSEHNLKGEY